MRRFIFVSILFLAISVVSAFAVPAKRGIWQTVKLSDGTEVRVELRGDEHFHWWQAENGTRYVSNSDGSYSVLSDTVTASAAKRMRSVAQRHRALVQKRRANGDKSIFQGEKKGLIILVDFPNQSFSMNNSRALYNRIANEPGYSDHDFNGSISDYFKAQSGGQFTLDFDVVGPVRMSHNYSYYGRNNEDKAPEMIKEACEGVDSTVDFSKYDWDGDGEVEEVFVLYAGHGQADYDQENDDLIWPHMYWINADGDPANYFYLDNVKIDVYACTSELNGSSNIAGIGTFCHEFSHCMGFPDIYDTSENPTNFGMGAWDLMDYGSYNGNGYTPAGYSGYERMVCGWTNPVELTKDTTITNIQPLIDMGQSYIVYNKGNRNEYYILTNRQQHGYDASIPGHGMLIEHIDYDEELWNDNVVNTTDNSYYPNDHQRITIFHANNSESTYRSSGAAYPYNGNDSLTNNSRPAAIVYNANSDGSKYMNCAIRNITENSDGTMSFVFGNKNSSSSGDTTIVVPTDGVLFHETFDKCNGTGGNDGKFSGSIATGKFNPDNEGWTSSSEGLIFGGNKCARFNVGSSYVEAKDLYSPPFSLNGDTITLSFRAAAWNKDKTSLGVTLLGSNAKLVDSGDLTMQNNAWKSYTLKIVGTGSTRIIFTPGKRFFLDDVLVVDPKLATGIKSVKTTKQAKDSRIYTIYGQYVGTDFKSLPRGIYIINGRKVVR